MSDLTERLRTSDGFKVSMASDGHPYIHADKELLTEAAARIEELEAALREMRDALCREHIHYAKVFAAAADLGGDDE